MSTAWRESGEIWSAVSSRIVTARRRIVAIPDKAVESDVHDSDKCLCTNPPSCPRKESASLQDTIDRLCPDNVLFNTRVGSSERQEDDCGKE